MKLLDNVRIYDPVRKLNSDICHLKLKDGRFHEINEGRFRGSPENYEVIDGQGRVLMPSFNDSHLHLLRYGLMKEELDLRKARSWAQASQMIKEESEKELKEGEWIVARGLTDNKYDDIAGLIHAKDLDKIEKERPMFVLHKDGHECVINTPALKKVKQNEKLSINHDKFIETNPDGDWTGRFKDTAVHFIKFHFRSKSEEEIASALEAAFPFLAPCGITSIHTDDLNYAGKYSKVWEGYRALEKEGHLAARAYLHHYVFDIEDMKYFLDHSDKRSGDGSEKVRVGAFKIFVDGTHRLHTAALQEPYHDQPNARGVLNYAQDELNAMLQLAEDNNMQVAMHCIGDRAVASALKAIRSAGNSMRHRVIHAQTLSDELLETIGEVQPCVETQPGFLLDEWNRYAKWVGEKRGPYCGMGASLMQTGAIVTLSSDAPIGPINPFEHIFAAVNRTDHDGNPEGGWMPRERLDLSTAISGYTSTPAYLEFSENEKGIIKEGALADFILLDEHPQDIPLQEMHETTVQQTWLAGEKIFDKSQQ